MKLDPNERYDVDQALNDPWIQEGPEINLENDHSINEISDTHFPYSIPPLPPSPLPLQSLPITPIESNQQKNLKFPRVNQSPNFVNNITGDNQRNDMEKTQLSVNQQNKVEAIESYDEENNKIPSHEYYPKSTKG